MFRASPLYSFRPPPHTTTFSFLRAPLADSLDHTASSPLPHRSVPPPLCAHRIRINPATSTRFGDSSSSVERRGRFPESKRHPSQKKRTNNKHHHQISRESLPFLFFMLVPTDKRPAAIARGRMLPLVLLTAAAVLTPSRGFVVLPGAPSTAAAAVAARKHSSPRGGSVSAGCATKISAGRRHGATSGWIQEYPSLLRSHGGSSSQTPITTKMMATPLPETPDGPPKEELRPALVYGESATRSFVKALAWRLTAGVVTLISGLVFSGSLSTAMSIVGSDFVTKSGFMFAGERVWNKVKWGQDKTGDSAKRSLAKAVLWRVFAASNTLICGVFLAKDLSVASKIAGTDTIFKTALFFLNERMWTKINWGKEYEPEYYL